VAGQGVDRRLREVRVTTQPAAGYAYAYEHVLTKELLQPRAQLDRLSLRVKPGRRRTLHHHRLGRSRLRGRPGRVARRAARRAAPGAQHEGADHDPRRDGRSCPCQGPYQCHPPRAMADGPPPELSAVADHGLVALTALLKCMTGGGVSGGISCGRWEGPLTCVGLELVLAPTRGSAPQ